MKAPLLCCALLLCPLAATAQQITPTAPNYDPSLFAGLTFTFGGPRPVAGFGVKLLTTNKPQSLAGVAGVTYNFDGRLGCDLGLGYNTSSSLSASFGYDFCAKGLHLGLGARAK